MKLYVNLYYHRLNDLMKLMSDDETLSVSVLSSQKVIVDFMLLFQSSTSSSLINLIQRASNCMKKIRSFAFIILIMM